MTDCKPVHTLVDTAGKIGALDGDLLTDLTSYRSLAGAFQYLMFTRPDISYAVQQVCMHMHAPHTSHFNALKRILRYVKGTMATDLYLRRNPISSLIACTDADWAGCPDTRRSTSGYCVFLGDNLISWSSKRQTTISRSSAEAEYRGVANVVAELCWICNLLLELAHPPKRASLVYCDNVSAIYMSGTPYSTNAPNILKSTSILFETKSGWSHSCSTCSFATSTGRYLHERIAPGVIRRLQI
ncbi:hypothetical protein E3N88_08236 [Mikania micrantha]|uniref:Reverse transcriptase Ty1/copia-type domain-containing protein n=1 Tax=Mikania micrantha TaxID=192012 RepID=A0A5N6PHK9_9ASTR|nr:hypothetical protein E3N88_08236 [Mikania micrantha]